MRRRVVGPLLVTALLGLPVTATAPATAQPTAREDEGAAVARAASGNPRVASVVVVSVDGLNPRALTRLGRQRTPHLHRLLHRGASTRNARTVVEVTTTLPNHTSMVTGRRVDAERGGHGVDWNDDRTRPRTVAQAAGEPVASVFTAVDAAGRSSALFAGKTKFSLWRRSWGGAVDRTRIDEDDARLARKVRRDLRRRDRALRFWHVATPDRVGHASGFMGPRYLRAVRRVDARVGRMLRTIRSTPRLRGKVAVLLTSDHGGATGGTSHSDASRPANRRILFVAHGPGIARGADLYALNRGHRRNPGRSQPSYAATRQPVRNGDVGNLALDLLGLPALTGSQLDADQRLTVVRR